MILKKRIAHTLVANLHSEEEAQKAEDNFSNTFQKKEIPEEMEEIKCENGELLSEVLVKNKILPSKSEWRRLVLNKAVHDLMGNADITDTDMEVRRELTLKIGKKRFIKILIN
jgi:tyrosyl-tRNA synthetase